MTEDGIASNIESIGMYTPSKIRTTEELMNSCLNKPKLDLQRITGIVTRRVRRADEDSLDLAVAAAKDCLKNSKYEAKDLDIIINTSITRFVDGLVFTVDPPISLLMKKELNAEKALYFDLTNACAGMITGAYILDNMIKAGIVKNGMIVSGEAITPIADNAVLEIKEGIDPQFASLTVGDAGAALIIDQATDDGIGIKTIDLLTFAKFSELCFGMPSVEHPGVAMYTDAIKIHATAISRLPSYLEKHINIPFENYDVWIPHQTSTKAMKIGSDHIAKHFDLEELPPIVSCVEEFGNTSSTAVIVALYGALQKGEIKEGDEYIIMIMASGLVMGFITAKMGKLKVHEKEKN